MDSTSGIGNFLRICVCAETYPWIMTHWIARLRWDVPWLLCRCWPDDWFPVMSVSVRLKTRLPRNSTFSILSKATRTNFKSVRNETSRSLRMRETCDGDLMLYSTNGVVWSRSLRDHQFSWCSDDLECVLPERAETVTTNGVYLRHAQQSMRPHAVSLWCLFYVLRVLPRCVGGALHSRSAVQQLSSSRDSQATAKGRKNEAFKVHNPGIPHKKIHAPFHTKLTTFTDPMKPPQECASHGALFAERSSDWSQASLQWAPSSVQELFTSWRCNDCAPAPGPTELETPCHALVDFRSAMEHGAR